jgi:uncharacterized protein (DUF58 family)
MTPTPRVAVALAALSVLFLVVPAELPLFAALALAAALVVDGWWAHRTPVVQRVAPTTLARGVPSSFTLRVAEDRDAVRVRQPLPPDLRLAPASEGEGELDGELLARRRGRHVLPPVVARRRGPLGLAAWTHRVEAPADVVVYPDLPAARRLASSVRAGRFRDEGLRRRGPLGLGTEFESVRDYSPDDDIRQVNWRATERLGRPMSNQYRVERDRDVVCVIDCGRLMAAPFADRTRLDAALDAAVAVAAVADVLGDRCGAIAFAGEILRSLPPRRAGARDVVHTIFDLEPRPVDSDYELAFQHIRGMKRAFVLVLTDLLEESAARPLVEALPVVSVRHAVTVAGAADIQLEAAVHDAPQSPADVYRAAVALGVLDARATVSAHLRRAGAYVVEAPPDALAAACVRAYLRAKWTARF